MISFAELNWLKSEDSAQQISFLVEYFLNFLSLVELN